MDCVCVSANIYMTALLSILTSCITLHVAKSKDFHMFLISSNLSNVSFWVGGVAAAATPLCKKKY